MAQPIVKYTLNKKGQTPEWINTSDSSFAGQHGITGNKTGYIPKYESPQDTIFLGIASGDPDPDGTPDDYVGILTTKALLQTYITETGSTLKYKTTTLTVTGIQTATTTGLSTAWNQESYSGGLSTTTSTKYTASGVGTVATIPASQVTKVVVATDTTTGSSDATTETPIVIDAASTLSGVSTSSSVGVVTTTDAISGLAITTTTERTRILKVYCENFGLWVRDFIGKESFALVKLGGIGESHLHLIDGYCLEALGSAQIIGFYSQHL